jgi:hypothetical protein
MKIVMRIDGMITVNITTDLMVLPFDIVAINGAVKAAQLIHQIQ